VNRTVAAHEVQCTGRTVFVWINAEPIDPILPSLRRLYHTFPEALNEARLRSSMPHHSLPHLSSPVHRRRPVFMGDFAEERVVPHVVSGFVPYDAAVGIAVDLRPDLHVSVPPISVLGREGIDPLTGVGIHHEWPFPVSRERLQGGPGGLRLDGDPPEEPDENAH